MTEAKQAPNQYGKGFLSASDLLVDGEWRQFTLVISDVFAPKTVKADNGQVIDRPVIQFQKATKLYAPGATALKLLHHQTGVDLKSDHRAQAIGQRVTLYPVVGSWFKYENLAGIRVRIDKEKPKPMIKKKDMGNDITGERYELIEVVHVEPEKNQLSEVTQALATATDLERVAIIEANYTEGMDEETARPIRAICLARRDQLEADASKGADEVPF